MRVREEIGGPREGDNNVPGAWCAGQGHTRRTGRLARTQSPAKPGTGFIVFVTITLFSVIPTLPRGGQRLSALTTTGTLAGRAPAEPDPRGNRNAESAPIYSSSPFPLPGGGRGLPRARRPGPGGRGGRVSTPWPGRRLAGHTVASQSAGRAPPSIPPPTLLQRISGCQTGVQCGLLLFSFWQSPVPTLRSSPARSGRGPFGLPFGPPGPWSLPVAHALFEGRGGEGGGG